MKKTALILAALLASTGIFADAKAMNEEEAKTAAVIESLDFNISVDTILGGGETIHDSGSYFLKIKDGKVKSYLPFIGESFTAVLGTEDQSLSFDGPVKIKMDKSQAKKTGQYTLKFKAKAPSSDWDVTIELWTSGSATITCFSPTKSQMTYWGTIDL